MGGLWCGVLWCGVLWVGRVGGLVRWVGGMDGMGALGRLGKWVGCGRRSASHTGVFVFPLVHPFVDVCVVTPSCFLCPLFAFVGVCVYRVCVHVCTNPWYLFFLLFTFC